MKRFSIVLFTFLCAAAIGLCAEGGKKKGPSLTPEQKEFNKKMVEKYDANKDGKLDKEERAKMCKEDKEEMKKLFPPAAKAKKKE